MTRRGGWFGIGFLLLSAPVRSGQPAHSSKLTLGARGGLAFPHVAMGTDPLYRGDVQVSWQAEVGVGIGRRMALGVEAVHHRTPDFAGDCLGPCPPQPDYTALSARLTWAPGRGDRRPAILLAAGAGLYRVGFRPTASTEFGAHAVLELPVVRLGRAWWVAPALRGDAVPGVAGSGLYVVSLTMGLRYWGL